MIYLPKIYNTINIDEVALDLSSSFSLQKPRDNQYYNLLGSLTSCLPTPQKIHSIDSPASFFST